MMAELSTETGWSTRAVDALERARLDPQLIGGCRLSQQVVNVAADLLVRLEAAGAPEPQVVPVECSDGNRSQCNIDVVWYTGAMDLEITVGDDGELFGRTERVVSAVLDCAPTDTGKMAAMAAAVLNSPRRSQP